MKLNVIKMIWFASIQLPVCVFFVYPSEFFTVPVYLGFTSIIFYFGLQIVQARASQEITESLLLQVNAINHNVNEALVSAMSRNEPVSLQDSLSIKENLYAIESMIPTRRESLATHHRSISPLLSVTLQDYADLAKQSGIHFQCNFDADQRLRIIKVNPSILNKALSIILSNAISVTPKGGVVSVTTELTETHYTISVFDYGGGIKSSVLLKLNKGDLKTFGRRIDKHNRAHYGLGFVSLKRLLLNTNITAKTTTSGGMTEIKLSISRRVDGIRVKECANL
ncbi:Sensor protein CreC [Vibrio cholerae]|nr:Sensor protein CreC [Vibrio cholerae]